MDSGKSETAFRTISEVADLLDVQPHVLRFWEGKFAEIQPLKRAAGRRLYRPEDVALITGIRHLLYEQGLTIKGVQKMIRENGVGQVRDLALAPEGQSRSRGLSGAQRRALETARQELVQARVLLVGEDG